MARRDECLKYDIPLTADELFLIDQALKDTLERLAVQRMILLDNGKIESYDAMVRQTCDHELLLNKIRRKEL